MNIPEWFGLGVGACAALWWWRWCVRQAMWTWDDRKPNFAAGFVGGSIMFLASPAWVPIAGVIKGAEHIKLGRVTVRAFPDPRR